MSMTTSVRIGPVRAQGYSGQRAHDLRHGKPLLYVDSSRSHLNTGGFVASLEEWHELNEDGKVAAREAALSLWEVAQASGDENCIKEARAAKNACRQRYDRNGVVAYRMIITFGREALAVVEGLDRAEIDALAWKSLQAVAETLGTSVHGIGSHRDESALHYHAYLLGVTNAGRKLNPDKKACRRIQDAAAKPFAYLGIKRGKSKDMWIEEGADPSTYINQSVAELHAKLPLELAAARQQLGDAQEELERMRQEVVEAQASLKQAQLESACVDLSRMLADEEVQKLQIQVLALEGEACRLKALGSKWDQHIKAKEVKCRQLDAEIEAKNRELDNLLGVVGSTREHQVISDRMQHEQEIDAEQRQINAQKGPQV